MGRKKQQELPGTERDDKIDSIEEADENLREIKAKLRKLRDDKVAAELRLVNEMRSHNRTEYRYRSDDGVGRKITVSDEAKVKQSKVRTTTDSEDAAGDGDEMPS